MIIRLKTSLSLLFFWMFLLVVFSSCIDDKYTTDPTHTLSFSTDTVSFDTLFAGIPSHTAIFKIYNRHKEALHIQSIYLAGGEQSSFRYNVDGRIPNFANQLTDIVIQGRDSMFVFLEFTDQDTTYGRSPLVVDKMCFKFNGSEQSVSLVAYSQDAVILRSHTIDEDVTFTADKPYLIFDSLVVADGRTLTLAAGARLYFHSQANLIVRGEFVAQGSAEDPILLQGDRFDCVNDVDQTPYYYLPGQWGSIYLINPHGQYQISYTTIRGTTMGILLIGANRSKPSLSISHSVIEHSANYGVFSQNAHLSMDNSMLTNCLQSCCVILGGSCHMSHTTIANYNPYNSRSSASLVVSNYASNYGYNMRFPIESAVFENSIIYGSLFDELLLQSDTSQTNVFNVLFSHCLLKTKQSSASYFHNIVWSNVTNGWGEDTLFVNTHINKEQGYFNFQLEEYSLAQNKGNLEVAQHYPIDLVGKSRLSDGSPDIGAYEK